MTPEGKIQKKIIDYLENKGYTCIKMIKTSKNGIPDLFIGTGNGNHFWIEVKTETGITSKLQEYFIKQLREKGDSVLIPYGWEDFLKQYNEYKK